MIEIKTIEQFIELPGDVQKEIYKHIINLVLYAGAHVVAEIDVRDMLGQPNTTLIQQYDVSECVIRELVLEFVGSLGK